jgi:sucrose phosphorylase
MNISFFDALSNPSMLQDVYPQRVDHETVDLQVDRFIAAQAIMLSLIGLPGIYFHSLFGSRGWMEGVKTTGHNRTINREKFRLDPLERELADPASLRYKVFTKYSKLLSTRRDTSAFHPHGTQTIIDLHPSIFALERISPDGSSHALCLHNVSKGQVSFSTNYNSAIDLFTGQEVSISTVTLAPYEVKWLKTDS